MRCLKIINRKRGKTNMAENNIDRSLQRWFQDPYSFDYQTEKSGKVTATIMVELEVLGTPQEMKMMLKEELKLPFDINEGYMLYLSKSFTKRREVEGFFMELEEILKAFVSETTKIQIRQIREKNQAPYPDKKVTIVDSRSAAEIDEVFQSMVFEKGAGSFKVEQYMRWVIEELEEGTYELSFYLHDSLVKNADRPFKNLMRQLIDEVIEKYHSDYSYLNS
jgi:hypothetical protein